MSPAFLYGGEVVLKNPIFINYLKFQVSHTPLKTPFKEEISYRPRDWEGFIYGDEDGSHPRYP
jgi:hypothetical protein